MTKSFFLSALTNVAFLLIVSSVTLATPDHPNIVLFLVDDMGIMDTSLPFLTDDSGVPERYPLNDFYQTPNMEKIARSGVRFNHFYAMSVCSPTRISLMSGQNAARHRTTNWINPGRNNRGPWGPLDWQWQGLAKNDVTLARLLQGRGFHTIHIGKGHFGPQNSEGAEPRNLGFHVNVGGASFGQPGSYYAQKNFGHGTKRGRNAVPHLQAYHGTETFLSEALTLEAKSHVSQAVKSDKPFFLYMSHYAVHAPFESDPRFAANYVQSGKSKAAQAFATLIEGMDKSLGDILDHLHELDVAENTLILFLGDNGSDAPLGHQHAVACAAPLRGKKGAHYEGGMRVPFIATWAKQNSENRHQQRLPIAAGSIQPQLAAVHDLFPTIIDLLEISLPQNHIIDGVSLATLLTGNPDPERTEEFLMHYPHAPHRSNYFTSFRADDWKVIYHYIPTNVSNGSHFQLYNLARDPFESTNVADTEPQQLRLMMQRLLAKLEHHKAVYPRDPQDGVTPLLPQVP